jgi:prepilin-type N-terminal cleavage/methylation domain-containing protein
MKRIMHRHMDERGFTLIELLVVSVIMTALAISILPQLSRYKNEAYCGRVESDAGNAVVAMEAYYAANLAYGTLRDAGFSPSAGVIIEIASTDPLSVKATTETGRCPEGDTFTLSQGQGTWG